MIVRIIKTILIVIVTTKKQSPWLSIFPWNVKPIAVPRITAIIAENDKKI
jgi:hypothetical protein